MPLLVSGGHDAVSKQFWIKLTYGQKDAPQSADGAIPNLSKLIHNLKNS